MINWEYFKERIDELEMNECKIAIIQDEPTYCYGYDLCKDCCRAIKNGNELFACSQKKLVEWAMSEHEEKLKPCPFCGGKAVTNIDETGKYKVFCTSCIAKTDTYTNVTYAIQAWNRRK